MSSQMHFDGLHHLNILVVGALKSFSTLGSSCNIFESFRALGSSFAEMHDVTERIHCFLLRRQLIVFRSSESTWFDCTNLFMQLAVFEKESYMVVERSNDAEGKSV